MADQDVSQAEVWDDSALLDSWNEAFEEYKKYHSLAAKGKKVRLNIEKAAPVLRNGDVQASTEITPSEETSRGAIAEDQSIATASPAVHSTNPTAVTALPQALLNNVQDDALKNIMMSWYYAGYYTGLYEGKQQGYASAMQQSNT